MKNQNNKGLLEHTKILSLTITAYKLTIQDKDPDEFKELVDTYAAKHPLNKY